ncbi:hypothetical protein IEO21_10401 [Rhodonia placenta]|uniref:Uncharacterized protein n=1 Tax=Rhodonia placenta TaxID=104341 RepID=A0A8H7TX01_9APHY|nr:hypothetical protein IEO21_10401 [Postia placenta]
MSSCCSTSVAHLSASSHGEHLELDLSVDLGGDAAQVLVAEFQGTIPGTVSRTLEQCGEFRGELGELYLCGGGVIEIAEVGFEGREKGRFISKWGLCSLDLNLDGHKLGKDRVAQNEQLQDETVALDDCFSVVLKREEVFQCLLIGRRCWKEHYRWGGMENGPGAEAVVVAVRRADFGGSECASGLAAATTIQALKEARGRCHVQQGL